jgi:hypothetical protein
MAGNGEGMRNFGGGRRGGGMNRGGMQGGGMAACKADGTSRRHGRRNATDAQYEY